MSDRDIDRMLMDAVLGFAGRHPSPDMAPFLEELCAMRPDWQPVQPAWLDAAQTLSEVDDLAVPATRDLLQAFICARHSRRWEQSYKRSDNLVGQDMLDGYGFAEIIGKNGPFVSDKVRAGLGVWGKGIDYPMHSHKPEEIYVGIAGGARFTVGEAADAKTFWAGPGDAVLMPSLMAHGFRTEDQPFVVFYVWRAGDMRETSQFR